MFDEKALTRKSACPPLCTAPIRRRSQSHEQPGQTAPSPYDRASVVSGKSSVGARVFAQASDVLTTYILPAIVFLVSCWVFPFDEEGGVMVVGV